MIKYRYNMSIDPEPMHTQRVQVWVAARENEWNEHAYLGDIWFRVNCNMRVSGVVYGRWPKIRIGRSHRSVPKSQWRWERSIHRALCGETDHSHWYNGDRYRPWGNFRGHTTTVIDLDAFKRMRSMYRAKKK
jgi:hypothetical protein